MNRYEIEYDLLKCIDAIENNAKKALNNSRNELLAVLPSLQIFLASNKHLIKSCGTFTSGNKLEIYLHTNQYNFDLGEKIATFLSEIVSLHPNVYIDVLQR